MQSRIPKSPRAQVRVDRLSDEVGDTGRVQMSNEAIRTNTCQPPFDASVQLSDGMNAYFAAAGQLNAEDEMTPEHEDRQARLTFDRNARERKNRIVKEMSAEKRLQVNQKAQSSLLLTVQMSEAQLLELMITQSQSQDVLSLYAQYQKCVLETNQSQQQIDQLKTQLCDIDASIIQQKNEKKVLKAQRKLEKANVSDALKQEIKRIKSKINLDEKRLKENQLQVEKYILNHQINLDKKDALWHQLKKKISPSLTESDFKTLSTDEIRRILIEYERLAEKVSDDKLDRIDSLTVKQKDASTEKSSVLKKKTIRKTAKMALKEAVSDKNIYTSSQLNILKDIYSERFFADVRENSTDYQADPEKVKQLRVEIENLISAISNLLNDVRTEKCIRSNQLKITFDRNALTQSMIHFVHSHVDDLIQGEISELDTQCKNQEKIQFLKQASLEIKKSVYRHFSTDATVIEGWLNIANDSNITAMQNCLHLSGKGYGIALANIAGRCTQVYEKLSNAYCDYFMTQTLPFDAVEHAGFSNDYSQLKRDIKIREQETLFALDGSCDEKLFTDMVVDGMRFSEPLLYLYALISHYSERHLSQSHQPSIQF